MQETLLMLLSRTANMVIRDIGVRLKCVLNWLKSDWQLGASVGAWGLKFWFAVHC